jgi:hypothetical protein
VPLAAVFSVKAEASVDFLLLLTSPFRHKSLCFALRLSFSCFAFFAGFA